MLGDKSYLKSSDHLLSYSSLPLKNPPTPLIIQLPSGGFTSRCGRQPPLATIKLNHLTFTPKFKPQIHGQKQGWWGRIHHLLAKSWIKGHFLLTGWPRDPDSPAMPLIPIAPWITKQVRNKYLFKAWKSTFWRIFVEKNVQHIFLWNFFMVQL